MADYNPQDYVVWLLGGLYFLFIALSAYLLVKQAAKQARREHEDSPSPPRWRRAAEFRQSDEDE
jgi:hypothetical protein